MRTAKKKGKAHGKEIAWQTVIESLAPRHGVNFFAMRIGKSRTAKGKMNTDRSII
jgi:hypothetical protein